MNKQIDKETILNVFDQLKRMCKSHDGCVGCPLVTKNSYICNLIDEAEDDIEIVADWIEHHQIRTNRDEFYRRFPSAEHYFLDPYMNGSNYNDKSLCCAKLGFQKQCYHGNCKKCWDEIYDDDEEDV